MDKKLKNVILNKQGKLLYTTLSEECAELTQACSKTIRKQFFDEKLDKHPDVLDNFLEEICDVEINLELIRDQLANDTSFTRDEIEKMITDWHNKKIEKISKIFL